MKKNWELMILNLKQLMKNKNIKMNKQELKRENEELLFEIKNLNKENKQLKEQINDLNLKKFAIERPVVDLDQAKLVYEWLKFDPNVYPVDDKDEQKELWNEFFMEMRPRFVSIDNDEFELNFENDVKGKYRLVKL